MKKKKTSIRMRITMAT